jgi:hypothetical protein
VVSWKRDRVLHVFITKDHFPKCHEAALYGVRPSSLNQLAQVRDGDEAFLYNRVAGNLYGPYRCRGPVRYLGPDVDAPVWEAAGPGSRREKFRFVVGLEAPPETLRYSVPQFYEAAGAAGIELVPADFVKRSVYTFLPGHGERFRRELAGAGYQKAMPFLPPSRPLPLEKYVPVDGKNLEFILQYELLDESMLEFLLAREPTALAEEMGARPAFNQLRIDGRGNRIDLVYASADALYIIELKRGRRGAEARRDILRYEIWARGRRGSLAEAFGLRRERPTVTPVLVAAGGPSRPADCRIYDWRLDENPARLSFTRVQ